MSMRRPNTWQIQDFALQTSVAMPRAFSNTSATFSNESPLRIQGIRISKRERRSWTPGVGCVTSVDFCSTHCALLYALVTAF